MLAERFRACLEQDHGGKGGEANRFSLPSTLTERVAVVPPGAKPLALLIELQSHFDMKKPKPMTMKIKEVEKSIGEYDDDEGPMGEDSDDEKVEEEVSTSDPHRSCIRMAIHVVSD